MHLLLADPFDASDLLHGNIPEMKQENDQRHEHNVQRRDKPETTEFSS